MVCAEHYSPSICWVSLSYPPREQYTNTEGSLTTKPEQKYSFRYMDLEMRVWIGEGRWFEERLKWKRRLGQNCLWGLFLYLHQAAETAEHVFSKGLPIQRIQRTGNTGTQVRARVWLLSGGSLLPSLHSVQCLCDSLELKDGFTVSAGSQPSRAFLITPS